MLLAAPLGYCSRACATTSFTHFFRPTANRLCDERTYITPSDKAGVAISNSPIELVAEVFEFPARGDDQHLPVFV